jgi:2-polyprenyl-6-hydroxyphenyl methylase/3-demethylubiquinone-9 3-methyltransferase
MSWTEHNPAVAFHDQLAGSWEQKYARGTFNKRAQAILTMPAGEPRAGEYWLDAGCGTGTIARRLAQQGYRVTAVDGSPRMIEAAKRAASGPDSLPLCFLRVNDVAELPFADATFDAIVCSSVLEYVDTPSLVLREFARVLRPAGRLIVSIPNRRALLRRTQKVTHWITSRCRLAPWPRYIGLSKHAYTREEFANVLRASAFEARAWRYYGAGLPDALSDTRYGGALLIVACVKSEPRGATADASQPVSPSAG